MNRLYGRIVEWTKNISVPESNNASFLIAILFLILGILLRVPFRSTLLYHWDSVNFALGMEHFDVRLHQPHPPGYLLYVLIGRVVDVFFGDANSSLVWLSIAFSGLTAVMMYLLCALWFERKTAIISALIVLTSPSVWFFSEVALTYIVEAFFVILLAYTGYQALQGDAAMAVMESILLGVAGGIRQTTLILFLPLWLFSLRRLPWKVRIASFLVLTVSILSWLIPTVHLSGGLDAYLNASDSIGRGVLFDFELLQGGGAILLPFARLSIFVIYGLLIALIPLLFLLLKAFKSSSKDRKRILRDDRFHVFFLWMIPNLLLYAPLVRSPGHTFSFLPALIILAALGTTYLIRALSLHFGWSSQVLTIVLVSLIVLLNASFYLAAPNYLFNIQRVATTTTSWKTIENRDSFLSHRINAIEENFDPTSTLIISSGIDFRHPDYYLREYQNYHSDMFDTEDLAIDDFEYLVFFSLDQPPQVPGIESLSLANGDQLPYLATRDGWRESLLKIYHE